MAFRFALEVLLRFRQSLEHQEELLLQDATHQLKLIRRQIEDTESELKSIAECTENELSNGLAAAELHFRRECTFTLLRHRGLLEQDASKKEQLRQERLTSFQDARRRREVIDALRHHQFEAHRQEQIRQEQRHLDDQFLLRRNFLRRS